MTEDPEDLEIEIHSRELSLEEVFEVHFWLINHKGFHWEDLDAKDALNNLLESRQIYVTFTGDDAQSALYFKLKWG